MFNDDKQDNSLIIRNLILLVLVIGIGSILILSYFKGNKKEEDNKDIFLMVTTIKTETIDGMPKTTTIGEDKYYKEDLCKEINNNGMNFVIDEFTNTSIALKINNEMIDLYDDLGCPNKLCQQGKRISLDGSKNLTLTDKSNTYSYTIYFQKKK